ncbi:hypothetical protein [Nocardia cyriacigeorgica]|uniref:hypothetical protein n=1 Tax=Nocardia cyriacigeorgica TaxID=135487 RepID=UPI0013D2B6D1|nr:hypothetical protein [Nocardia cyriacigeorgica]NEW27250.1 hypothetical protein [Nocardia cyriacigeorgica]
MPLLIVDEVMRGWRSLTDEQQADAQLLIDAAVAWVRDPERRPDIADDDPVGKRVVLEVVRAALAAGPDFTNHVSYADTMGPWSTSGTLATPAGVLIFSEAHERMLGISSDPVPRGDFGDPCDYRYPPAGAVLP